MIDFEVKIAQNNKEVEQALRLRYEIFEVEMGGDAKHKDAEGLDRDIYDKFCDHLIVIDRTKNKTVGTYRLLLGSKADKNLGFYAENFFDIHNIKRLNSQYEILELGRSCIHKDYRNRPMINLLWSGIADYIKDYNVRYLFGSARLLNNEPKEVSRIFKFVKEQFYAPPQFRVFPRLENKFLELHEDVTIDNPRHILRQLPPLIKGYLNTGAWICGLPAINPDFGSVVIFMLLDMQRLPSSHREHFL